MLKQRVGLESLPQELIDQILIDLSTRQLKHLRCLSQTLNILTQEAFWSQGYFAFDLSKDGLSDLEHVAISRAGCLLRNLILFASGETRPGYMITHCRVGVPSPRARFLSAVKRLPKVTSLGVDGDVLTERMLKDLREEKLFLAQITHLDARISAKSSSALPALVTSFNCRELTVTNKGRVRSDKSWESVAFFFASLVYVMWHIPRPRLEILRIRNGQIFLHDLTSIIRFQGQNLKIVELTEVSIEMSDPDMSDRDISDFLNVFQCSSALQNIKIQSARCKGKNRMLVSRHEWWSWNPAMQSMFTNLLLNAGFGMVKGADNRPVWIEVVKDQ